MKKLAGQTVLITGASGGIGAACATEFAAAGAKLLLCARRLDKLEKIAAQLQKDYRTDVHIFQVDVKRHTDVVHAFQALPERFQPVDILINNAGMAAGLDLVQEAHVQDWEDMIDTNLKGLLYVTKEVLPAMVQRNSGHIINLGSISSHQVYPKAAVYCATKHAVKALTEGFRNDVFGTKIRVSQIDPGAVHTNFSEVRFKGDTKLAEAVYEGMDALTAEDIAETILFCATRKAHVNISEVIIMPTNQLSVSMVSRNTRKT